MSTKRETETKSKFDLVDINKNIINELKPSTKRIKVEEQCGLCEKIFSIRNFKVIYHNSHSICSDCFDLHDDFINDKCVICDKQLHVNPIDEVYNESKKLMIMMNEDDYILFVRQVVSQVHNKIVNRILSTPLVSLTQINLDNNLFSKKYCEIALSSSIIIHNNLEIIPNLPLLELIFEHCFDNSYLKRDPYFKNDPYIYLNLLSELSNEKDEALFI